MKRKALLAIAALALVVGGACTGNNPRQSLFKRPGAPEDGVALGHGPSVVSTGHVMNGGIAVSVVESFRKAAESGDYSAVVPSLAPDVALHSPAVIGTDYQGSEMVGRILGPAMQVLQDARFTDVLHGEDGRSHGLVLEARIRDQRAQGFIYLQERDGLVAHLTFMVRPLRAVQAFVEEMGARGAPPALDYQAGQQ